MVAECDLFLPKHPALEKSIPNLHVIKALQVRTLLVYKQKIGTRISS